MLFKRLPFRLSVSAVLLVLTPVSLLVTFARARPEFNRQPQQVASRPFPPARYIPDHNFDTRHIALNLGFDWAREQVIGTETIVVAPLLNNLGQIELDAANMTFTSVILASGIPLKFETDTVREKLRITLDRRYQPSQELTLTIEYHTNGPESKRIRMAGGGIRFVKPTSDDPGRPKQIWSQGESEYNHYWFAWGVDQGAGGLVPKRLISS